MKKNRPSHRTSSPTPLTLKPDIISNSAFEFPDFLKIIEEAKASGFLEGESRFSITPSRDLLAEKEAQEAFHKLSRQESNAR